MKKDITTFIIALVIGLILGRFVLSQYKFEGKIVPTFNQGAEAYFIQQGVYSTLESMKESTAIIPYYIYNLEDDKYYVYIGITLNENNANKIKGYYEELGYNIYVKKINLNNKDFITVLNQYDSLLEKSSDKELIGTVCSQILNKYEELVLKSDS